MRTGLISIIKSTTDSIQTNANVSQLASQTNAENFSTTGYPNATSYTQYIGTDGKTLKLRKIETNVECSKQQP